MFKLVSGTKETVFLAIDLGYMKILQFFFYRCYFEIFYVIIVISTGRYCLKDIDFIKERVCTYE